MTRWILRAAIPVGGILSLFLSFLTATRSFALGSAAGGWTYNYLYGFQPRALVVAAIVCGCCSVLAAVPLDELPRLEWRLVVLWIVAATAAQGMLRRQTPYTLEAVFISDGSNGFYSPTQQYSASALLTDFERLRPTFTSVHARSNMPGKLMLLEAIELVTQRPAALAWITIVVSNLGGILLYVFVRDYLQDQRAALLSLIFYLFVPARVFFLPVANTVTPIFIIGWAWLWVRWLQAQTAAWACVLGVALYGVVFYEPTPLVMGMLFAGLSAYAVFDRTLSLRTLTTHAAIAAAAFLVTAAVMTAAFDFNLLRTFQAIVRDAAAFNAESHRPYWTWVWRNPIDFLYAIGICQAVLLCGAVVWIAIDGNVWRDRRTGRAAALIAGIVTSVAAVDLIGVNRGEVVRLWIFLACFAQIPAAYLCARLNSRAAMMLVVATSVVQIAVATSMVGFAQP